MCRNSVVNVIEIEKESISTTVTTYFYDHMETRLKALNSYKHSAFLMTTCGSNKSGLFQKRSIHPTEEISTTQGGVGCGKKKLLKMGCLQMTSCKKPDFNTNCCNLKK